MGRANIFFFIRNTNLTHIDRECARSFSTEYVVIVMYKGVSLYTHQLILSGKATAPKATPPSEK